ncbi:MAG: TonB-dependent receptor [Acidobacteriota bacterium]
MSEHWKSPTTYLYTFLVGLGLLITPAYPQANSGTITGTVFDPQDAVIPGVTVVVTQVDQDVSRTVVTNSSGIYSAQFLPVGRYTVSVDHSGFRPQVRTDLVLTVGQSMRVDFKLELGRETQAVEVQADASQALRLESSEISQIINHKQVSDLPLNGRNFDDLIPLNAGVTNGGQRSSNTGYNLNGSRSDQNMFLIEGIDNVNIDSNLIIRPPLDSIEEFQIQTGTFSAEYGRTAGGIVMVQLKSGTNALHGSLFEFLRNDKLDANGYFNNQVPPNAGETKAPRAALRRNQFGGTLGGPIVKSKTFFFGDYQGFREVVGKSTVQSVPTLLERQGDFTQTLAPGQTLFKNALLGQLYPECDPSNIATCQKIPGSALDPVAVKLANLYPRPNLPGVFIPGQGTINNFTISGKSVVRSDQFDIKLDHMLTSKDSLSFHYIFANSNSTIPAAFGDGTVGPCIDCGVVIDLLAGSPRGRNQNVGLTEVHTFSANTINEFRAGLNRSRSFYQTSDGGKNLASDVGIANVNVSPLTTGLPWFFFAPSPSWIGTSPFTPNINGYTTYQFTDNLSHVYGKHRLKTGFDLRRRMDNGSGNFFGKGAYIFVPLFTGNAFADFLTGRATVIQQDLTPGTVGIRGIEYGFYVQDDYKVSSRLTLNLGLRYDLYPGLVEVADRVSNLDVDSGVVDLAGLNGAPRRFVETDKNNWGPRLGFAYSLNDQGSMVVRGGYGISYFSFANSFLKSGLNPPYTRAFNQFNLSFTTFDAAYRISDGLPTHLVEPPETFDIQNPTGSYRQIQSSSRSPYSQYFSLNVQRSLPGNLVVDVGYVGTRGVHLPGELEGNPAPPGFAGTTEQRRIHRDTIPNVGSITLFANAFSSVYHSLQAKAEKRLSRGLQFLTTYTFSKSIDDKSGSSVTGGSDSNPGSKPQNPFDTRSDRGLSSFDRRHRFVSAFTYDLPIGTGKTWGSGWTPVLNGFLGGWQINGIVTLSSGLPFNVFASSSAGCGCSVGELRADRIKDGRLPKDQRSVNGWFDKTAFTDPPSSTATTVGRYGNSGRNIIPGPGLATVDFSLFKKFEMKEGRMFQFRAEFFNLFNRVNFLYPDSVQNASWQAGGIITRAQPARIGQLALKFIF